VAVSNFPHSDSRSRARSGWPVGVVIQHGAPREGDGDFSSSGSHKAVDRRSSGYQSRQEGVEGEQGWATLAIPLPLALADAIADRVIERMEERGGLAAGATPEPDRYMSTNEAASYLGMTTAALYKRVAAGDVPHHQDGPGCKLWFLRSELASWRSS
jgi:predicted DNA-binding transcriptional regulator AlpA